jgi:alkyldihydroxyacetonephosphate synthase
MRWWGWGDREHVDGLTPGALAMLRERVGIATDPHPPVTLASVELAPSRLGESDLARLRALLGAGSVRTELPERLLHSAGKGYPDLLRARAGKPAAAPDAVVYPRDRERLAALLDHCVERSIAVVPFGGGTSVVGGVSPQARAHRAVLSLDTAALDAVLGLDRAAQTVRVQGGIRAASLERRIAEEGFTLGHFPQSFEFVSIGGCIATRSAGQASTGYGSIAEMIDGVTLVAPAGTVATLAVPHTAAGPDLRQLIAGSEGTLGVVEEATLRVRRAPERLAYEGYAFADFASGFEALRELAQQRALPDVVRLSDESESEVQLALAEGRPARLLGGYLRARGRGCVVIIGTEGDDRAVRSRAGHTKRVLRQAGAAPLGSGPGKAWLHGRFAAPYLRDELLTLGVMVETMETATVWSNVEALHREVAAAVHDALEAQHTPGIVMCHVSHVYETGCSLYFTVIARQDEGREIEQWRSVKRASLDAIAAAGGTVTHHHAVGEDHREWYSHEVSPAGLRALAALRTQLDPTGIMNPGKLLAG